MRTKTIEVLIDRLFWAILLLLPIAAYLVINIHHAIDFITVLNQFYIDDSNLLYTGLVQMFGSSGYIAWFDTTNINPLFLYLSYMMIIEMIHIVVDVLLFIPRLCVKILDKATEVGKV